MDVVLDITDQAALVIPLQQVHHKEIQAEQEIHPLLIMEAEAVEQQFLVLHTVLHQPEELEQQHQFQDRRLHIQEVEEVVNMVLCLPIQELEEQEVEELENQ